MYLQNRLTINLHDYPSNWAGQRLCGVVEGIGWNSLSLLQLLHPDILLTAGFKGILIIVFFPFPSQDSAPDLQ